MKKDLDRIKKLYGEEFAKKFCRPYFSHILEREDFSFADFLVSKISPSKFFYEDLLRSGKIEKFKNALFGMLNSEKLHVADIEETPEELMKQAGYTLYKCNTNDDILKFKKYYAKGEEICTFNDDKRLSTHIVFWGVKDNADEIRRENFKNPRRQDEYGTSVISIQFTRGLESTLSIKNRYNHTVEHCDATFSNDLENIQAGLTDSFNKYYGIQLVNGGQAFDLPGYVVDNNGIYHKYNYEIENIYYCADNTIIKNGKSKHYDPTRYIIADYYIIDRKDKIIELFQGSGITDSFINQFGVIQKIDVTINNDNKTIMIYTDDEEPIELTINKYGQIIKFVNNNVEKLSDGFMQYSKSIQELTLDNVKEIGNQCLMDNTTLRKFNARKLIKIGHMALSSNISLKELSLNATVEIGNQFLISNEILENFECCKLKKVGSEFMSGNKQLLELSFPRIEKIGQGFMDSNDCATKFYAPLLDIDKYGMFLNIHLKELKKNNLFAKIMQKIPKIKKPDIWDLF